MVSVFSILGYLSSKIDNSVMIQGKKKAEIANVLLIEIFKYFNANEIATISLVSKQWKLLAEDKQLWINLFRYYECLPFKGNNTDLRSKKSDHEFLDLDLHFKPYALSKRRHLLYQNYKDGGVPLLLAKLFGGMENVLALPFGEISEEYLKEWFKTDQRQSFTLPQWHYLGERVQDDPICRINCRGAYYIAIRYTINLQSDFKWTKKCESGLGKKWKYLKKVGGEFESKIVLRLSSYEDASGSKLESWNLTDHSSYDSISIPSLEFKADLSTDPSIFLWLKKLISGQPCGFFTPEFDWSSPSFIEIDNLELLRSQKPNLFRGIEGPALNQDGRPMYQLWTGSKRVMSSLNIIEDYIPKE